MKKLLSLLFLGFIFSSHLYSIDYQYQLHNKTNETIRPHYEIYIGARNLVRSGVTLKSKQASEVFTFRCYDRFYTPNIDIWIYKHEQDKGDVKKSGKLVAKLNKNKVTHIYINKKRGKYSLSIEYK